MTARAAGKVMAPGAAAAAAAAWRAAGLRVVVARGAFDLLDAAQARALAEARGGADRLVAAVDDDAAVAAAEGAGAPVMAAAERAGLVAALRAADAVVVVDDAAAAAIPADARVAVAGGTAARVRARQAGRA